MYQEKAKHCKEKKRSKTLVFFLAVDVCICVCILLAAWAVFLKEPQAVALAPDSDSLEVEPNQTPLVEQSTSSESDSEVITSESVEKSDGRSRIALNYSGDVIISLSDKKAHLCFGSGSRSERDIVLQIVVQEQVIAQSGKVTPGNKVEQLDLADDAAEFLSAGECKGKFVLYFYTPETGERSNVVTNIPVTVMVQ